MQATDLAGSASITIDADPAAVYAAVSDVSLLGGLSPECHHCEWVEEGSRFMGHNRQGPAEWTTVCDVVTAEAGREFAYQAGGDDVKYTEWRYAIEPDGAGSRLTESFRVLEEPPPLVGADEATLLARQKMLVAGMEQTLAGIKAHVEGTG